MTASTTKTPLQAVVSVICDCLLELPVDDQARALEAVRITLGLGAPVAQPSSLLDRALPVVRGARQTPGTRALPMVRIEMMNDRPVVVGQGLEERAGGAFASVKQITPLRQLPPQGAARDRNALEDALAVLAPRRGYVRLLRPGT